MAKEIKQKRGLKICYIPYFGYETDDYAFDKKFEQRWTNVLKKKLEREGHSIATYDINDIKSSDFIICFDNTYFQNVRHFFNIWKAGKLGRTLYIDYEPPSAMCRIHSDSGLKKLSKLFTVMSYNDNVVNGKTIVKGVVGDSYEQEIPYKNDFDKRKLLCMVANNRVEIISAVIEPWPSELYSERKKIAGYFIKKHAKDFDLYGDFWPEGIREKAKGVLDREKKQEVIARYRFIISYDSITDQNGYVSEKLFDVLKSKTIPIYLGADNVTDYVPKDCFIDRRDFANYEELFKYIKGMSRTEYERRIKKIEEYLASDQYKDLFSSDGVANHIMDFFARRPRRINYVRALFILLGFEYIRRTKHYYDYDNYYLSEKTKMLAAPISGVDKAAENGKPYFLVFACLNKKRGELIYMRLGKNGERRKVETNLVRVNGDYAEVTFRIFYTDIVENNEIAIFIRGKGRPYARARLSHYEGVDMTRYDNVVWFKVKGHRIVCVKKRCRYYVSRVRQILGRNKR